jgi:hypothetical protein
MRTITIVAMLSMVILSTAALAGQDALPAANNPMSRGPKAAVPGLISYQGTLTDTNGVVLNTIVTMTFTIYTDSTAGSAVWTEVQPLVEVNNGLFNVLLGRVNAIPDIVFQDPERWLAVRVESDPELEPRQRMAAVGYAFRASEADTADFARAPAPSDGDWIIDGDNIYHVGGRVGIGTTAPEEELHVCEAPGSADAAVVLDYSGSAGGTARKYDISAWGADGGKLLVRDITAGNVNRIIIDSSGHVGVGTTAPSAKLDVSGDINADSLYKIKGNTVLSTPDTQNVFVGVGAGANNTKKYGTFVGANAGRDNSGDECTFVGAEAGQYNEGYFNTFIGRSAGGGNTTGWGNAFLGYIAGANNTTGEGNAFLGSQAGIGNTTGSHNTCIGSYAGVWNGIGHNNTYVGNSAGYNHTLDSNNVFVGSRAGIFEGGSNNVFIGFAAGALETGSDKLYIANNSDTSSVLIYGDFSTGNVGLGTLNPAAKLDVQGTLNVQSNNSLYGGYLDNQIGGGDGLRAYANVSNGNNWGAVYAVNYGTSPAIYALADTAGYFAGHVTVTGTMSKGGGSFKIDHPLDPANKYLYHSFVESPDMKNIYDGVAVLNNRGEAWVVLPDWFQALNRDFRYQLTCIGGFAPVFVAREISGNRFQIAGGEPGMKISWQVTGIRQDAFANAHRIPVEVEKSSTERGKYLHPKEHGVSETAGIDYEASRQKEVR